MKQCADQLEKDDTILSPMLVLYPTTDVGGESDVGGGKNDDDDEDDDDDDDEDDDDDDDEGSGAPSGGKGAKRGTQRSLRASAGRKRSKE